MFVLLAVLFPISTFTLKSYFTQGYPLKVLSCDCKLIISLSSCIIIAIAFCIPLPTTNISENIELTQ